MAALSAAIARAEEPAPSADPLRIGAIRISRANVFDASDGVAARFPYSLANRIHVITQETFIRRELLFREGDVFDPEVVAESERLLRARPIFRYVSISTSAAADGVVDVEIETYDTWTTVPRPTYGVAGGEQYYGMGIRESNFLGLGKQLGAFVFRDVDRTTRGVSYRDPQLFGTRWVANIGYGTDDKGREWEGGIERPYFASRVPYAGGAAVRVLDDEDRLFQRREEAVNFGHRTRDARVFLSKALSRSDVRVRRISLAHERQEDDFFDVRFLQVPEFPVPARDRVVSSLLLGFDYRDLDFETFRGVMTFDRVEDINHGWEWLVEAGPSLKSMGATRDGAFGRLQVQKVAGWGDRVLWFNHLDADGRLESRSLVDGAMRLRSEVFLPDWRESHTASLRAEWRASHNLDPETQFIVGGDNGLRAYRLREEAGANSAILSLENRRVVLYDWLKLVNIGWAVFADAGTAWQRHSRLRMNEIKSDVGAGLRFSPTRSTDPSIIRVDLAYALQDNDSSSRLALNIGADIHFGEREERKFEQ